MSTPTYREIQPWVKKKHGFTPKTCWIAHVREMCGLNPRKAANRLDPTKRANPCPPSKIKPIKEAITDLSKQR